VKIEFRQSGGVAGIARPPRTIDTETLPAADANLWHELVAGADFFQLPAAFPAGPRRDSFTYVVTVEEGGRRHTVRAGQGDGPPSLDRLLDHLRRYAPQ
jgi:hypothetical protein